MDDYKPCQESNAIQHRYFEKIQPMRFANHRYSHPQVDRPRVEDGITDGNCENGGRVGARVHIWLVRYGALRHVLIEEINMGGKIGDAKESSVDSK